MTKDAICFGNVDASAAACPILRPGDERRRIGCAEDDSFWTCEKFMSCDILFESARIIVVFEGSVSSKKVFSLLSMELGSSLARRDAMSVIRTLFRVVATMLTLRPNFTSEGMSWNAIVWRVTV